MAATMSMLKQAMGKYDQSVVCSCITPANYIADRCVIGVPTSTVPNMNFAGTSTRSGDLLLVLSRNMGPGGAGEAQKLHVSIVAQVILQLKESGAVVLE